VSIYVQYDQHVQQAVDERIMTRCRLVERVGESETNRPDYPHRDSVLSATIEKIARQGDAMPMGPSKMPRFDVSGSKSLPLTNFQSKL